MKATDFFEVLDAVGGSRFSIVNGKLNGSEILPAGVSLTVDRVDENVYSLTRCDNAGEDVKGIFSYGESMNPSFSSMTITDKFVCFVNEKGATLHFFGSNEVISADEVIVIHNGFAWVKTGKSVRFRFPQFSANVPYIDMRNIEKYGDKKILVAFDTTFGSQPVRVIYNSKLKKEIFRDKVQNVKKVKVVKNILLSILDAEYKERIINARGEEQDEF
ncbi:MAG: hypothetical protein LBR70_06225 [Lactobacillaceae bacterium]|jgi:hypothetical protein|nr:hypothetical protein [Lactobacillaceae bacterium]